MLGHLLRSKTAFPSSAFGRKGTKTSHRGKGTKTSHRGKGTKTSHRGKGTKPVTGGREQKPVTGGREQNQSQGEGNKNQSQGEGNKNQSQGEGNKNQSQGEGNKNQSQGEGNKNQSQGEGNKNQSQGEGNKNQSQGEGNKNQSQGEGNKNQSQGAKSGDYGGWVTIWISLAIRKSRVTAAVCALALSWRSSRPRTPVRGRHLHHARKILGKQWLTYLSAVTAFLSSSGMVTTWPNVAKKRAIICLEILLFPLNFAGRFSSGKPTSLTVALSRDRIGIPRFRLLLRYPKREETFLRPMFLACGCTNPPYPASALHSALSLWGTQRVQRFLTPRQSRRMRVRLPDEIFMISCFSEYVIFGFFLIRDSTLEMFSGVTVIANSTTTVIVF